jgi:ATP/ADP translocase
MGLKKEAAYTLYIWSDVFSVASVTLFWSITNDIYTTENAKKVYGFLGIGSQLGCMIGSFITGKIVAIVETEHLLLISSFVIIITIILFAKIDLMFSSSKEKEEDNIPEKPLSGGLSELYKNFLLVMRSRYLIYFALLLCFILMCSNLINYQFGRVIELSIIEKNNKTAFIASLYFWGGIISFVLLMFAPLFYKYIGIFGTLYLAPLVNLITIFGFTIFPVLSVITITRILDGSVKYGINQVTREMLYTPCTKEEKYRAKAVIDILFYRLVKVASAILMLIFSKSINLSIQQFNLVIIGVLFFNMCNLLVLKKSFIMELADKINKIFDDKYPNKNQYDEESFNEKELLKKLLMIVKEKISDSDKNIKPIEIIEKKLPELAPTGEVVYKNPQITKAIYLLSGYNKNPYIYSLCIQYLNLTLPKKMLQTYSLILSDNISANKILKMEIE